MAARTSAEQIQLRFLDPVDVLIGQLSELDLLHDDPRLGPGTRSGTSNRLASALTTLPGTASTTTLDYSFGP